jgi:hypothetical protein
VYSFAGGRSNLAVRPPALMPSISFLFNIMSQNKFNLNQAKTIGEQLGIRWDKFDLAQFRAGLGVELEHGTVHQTTNVTNDDLLKTGKIALAHLTEFPDYYTRLAKMEEEVKSYWESKAIKKILPGCKGRSGNRRTASASAKS